jgi:23S rRNA C2498 (ribose-2'-O)-methylase RlmM
MKTCWLGLHKWKIVEVKHYTRTYGYFGVSTSKHDITFVLYKCKDCNEIKKTEIDGNWSQEVLVNKEN